MFYDSFKIYLSKVFSIDIYYSSAYVRLLGPIVIFEKMSISDFIKGIGIGNIDYFLENHGLIIYQKGLANIGSNSFFDPLVSAGLIGFLITGILKITIFFKNKMKFNKKFFLFILFLIFDFGGDFIFLPFYWLLLFLIYFSISSKEKIYD